MHVHLDTNSKTDNKQKHAANLLGFLENTRLDCRID